MKGSAKQADLSTAVLIGMRAHRLLGRLPVSSETGKPSFRRGALVETLFGTAFPIPAGGIPALRPLWAEEAMNRATNMLQLVLLLEESSGQEEGGGPRQRLELALAENIATLFRSLHVLPETMVLPCNETLIGIVSGLVELFTPTVGYIGLTMRVSALCLPAYKRRALVLAATEFVTQTILHSFSGLPQAQIRITLEPIGNLEAIFMLEHDGFCADPATLAQSFGIAETLTALMEAEVVYRRSCLGGILIEFLFPV